MESRSASGSVIQAFQSESVVDGIEAGGEVQQAGIHVAPSGLVTVYYTSGGQLAKGFGKQVRPGLSFSTRLLALPRRWGQDGCSFLPFSNQLGHHIEVSSGRSDICRCVVLALALGHRTATSSAGK